MVGIILRRIEIGIHAALRAKCKQRLALRHAPGRAEKTFYDAAALKCLELRHERFNVAQGCHGDKVQHPWRKVRCGDGIHSSRQRPARHFTHGRSLKRPNEKGGKCHKKSRIYYDNWRYGFSKFVP